MKIYLKIRTITIAILFSYLEILNSQSGETTTDINVNDVNYLVEIISYKELGKLGTGGIVHSVPIIHINSLVTPIPIPYFNIKESRSISGCIGCSGNATYKNGYGYTSGYTAVYGWVKNFADNYGLINGFVVSSNDEFCDKQAHLACAQTFSFGTNSAYGGNSNVQTKSEEIATGDNQYYILTQTGIRIHPRYLISYTGNKFLSEGSNIQIKINHKQLLQTTSISNSKIIFSHPINPNVAIETESLNKYVSKLQIGLANANPSLISWQTIATGDFADNTTYTINYSNLNSYLGSDFKGKEIVVRIHQELNGEFNSSVSFYYYPTLTIPSFSATNPKCNGGYGSLSATIGNLQSNQASNVHFMYLIYRYDDTPPAKSGVSSSDASVTYNGIPYFFEQSLTSGELDAVSGTTTANISMSNVVPAGVYKLKVYTAFDEDGTHYLPAERVFAIEEPEILSANLSFQYTFTSETTTYHVRTGEPSANLTIAPSGGWEGKTYSYKINAGSVTPITGVNVTIPLNAASSHQLWIHNSDGCVSNSITFPFIAPLDIQISNISTSAVKCNSINSGPKNGGKVFFDVSLGLPNYYAYIDNPPSTKTITSAGNVEMDIDSPGNHTLNIYDATNGKRFQKTFTIGEPEAIVFTSVTATTPLCYNDQSTIEAITTGPVDYKKYVIFGTSSPNVNLPSVLPPGQKYTITASNNNGCSQSYNLTIAAAPIKIIIDTSTQKASCLSANNGSIHVVVSGGVPNADGYDILFDDGTPVQRATSLNKMNLNPKKYIITAKDKQCSNPQAIEVTLGVISNPMALSGLTPSPVSCDTKANGKIMASLNTVNRLAPPYNYDIKNTTKDTSFTKNGITTNTCNIQGLAKGNYTIKVTDNDGCSSALTTSVNTDANTLTWGLPAPSSTNASCPGINNGTISGTASSGFASSGYTYVLSRSGIADKTQKIPGTATFTNLLSGSNYYLSVKDDSSCVITSSSLTINTNSTPVSISIVEKKDQYCDEKVTGLLNINSSSSGYSIDSLILVHPNNSKELLAKAASAIKNNLPSGNYTIKAIDSHGCNNETPVSISNLRNYPKANFLAIDSAACNTIKDGKLTVAASETFNAGKYTYKIGTTTLSSPRTGNVQFSSLGAGNYTLNITDSIGCSKDTSFTFYTIKYPVAISNFTFDQASCVKAANAAIHLQAKGSKPGPGYYFVLNTKDTLTGQSVVFTNQAVKGNNKVVVYDKFGCKAETGTFWFPVRSDSLNIASGQIIDASCPGIASGKMAVNTLNGNPFTDGFSYSVINNLTKTAVIQRKGIRNDILTGLPKGTFYTEVTDEDNCYARTPNFSINEPSPVELSVSPGYIADKGASTGWANALATFGNGKYNIEWYSGNSVNSGNLLKSSTSNSSSDINLLTAGTYLVRVQDTAQCNYWGTNWLSSTFTIAEPSQSLALQLGSTKRVRCFGESNGEFTLKGIGGWGNNYRYGTDSLNVTSTSAVLTGFAEGNYKFFVKDTAGIIKSATFTMGQPAILEASLANITNARCYGSEDGSASLSITGGNGKYAVSGNLSDWTNGSTLSGLGAGSHSIYAHDSLDCQTSVEAVINQPEPLIITDTVITNTKCQQNEGSIVISNEGGTPTYSYDWYNEAALVQKGGNILDSLFSGVYTLKITDAHQCEMEATLYVSDLTNLKVDTILTEPVSCWGTNDGKASITMADGVPPYTITWPDHVFGDNVANLASGKYIVSVYDAEGCKVFNEFTISSPDSLWAQLVNLQLPLCKGVANGSIEVNASGGIPDYNYEWSTGRTRKNIINLEPGLYSLLITDANNCSRQYTYNIGYQENSISTMLPDDITLCKNSTYQLQPGNFEYTDWTKDGKYLTSDNEIEVNESGTYFLEYQDVRGCEGNDSIDVLMSESEMEAQFLMASVISLTDTVIIFEASDPIPDSIAIFLPDELSVIKTGQYFRYVVANDTGTFTISLVSYRNDCQDQITKSITVIPADPSEKNNVLKSASLIESFTMNPNPTDGNFDVKIKLSRKSDALVRIVSFGDGKTVALSKLQGDSSYQVPFNLNIYPGLYLINLKAGNEMRNIKMIVY